MISEISISVFIIFFCYILGSFPTAYLLVKKLKGIDIRTVGSGNVGASNAARVLGKWGFIAVLAADALKGFIPVFVLRHFYGSHDLVLLGAVAVVIGHTFTIFLGFKRGKAVEIHAASGGEKPGSRFESCKIFNKIQPFLHQTVEGGFKAFCRCRRADYVPHDLRNGRVS